jgi:hypothetical protein
MCIRRKVAADCYLRVNRFLPADADRRAGARGIWHHNMTGTVKRKETHMRKSLATVAITTGLGLTIAGCSSSPTAPQGTTGSTSTSSTIPTNTSLTSSSTSQVNILLYNINSDGPYYRALLTGAIGDFGPAVAIYPNGKVDQEHNSEMELDLSRGTFRLNIAQLEKKFFAHVMQHYPDYPATCSVSDSITVPVPIVAGSGTGAYRGITGTFTITVTAQEDLYRPCNSPTKQWEVILLTGQGTVSG